MKRPVSLAFLFLCAFGLEVLPAQETPIISVLDFSASGISAAETRILVDYISSHVVESGKYIVIDRMQRETILEEIEFSASDCVDERCQIELGRLLSANLIIVGSLGRIGERFILNIKLIQVETGRTLNTASAVYRSIEELIDNSKELTLRLTGTRERVAIEHPVPEGFAAVEAGRFRMGSDNPEEQGQRLHPVTLTRSIYMSRYEVTVGSFRRFVDDTSYKTTAEEHGGAYVSGKNAWMVKADANWRNPYFSQSDGHPVVCVSWYDAIEYCNWLSVKQGLTACYSGSGGTILCDFAANGYRLPTEAEWEYAARGGNKSQGYAYSGGDSLDEVGWCRGNSNSSQPVGQKRPNELGIYDMSGNAWEWCWDWYEDNGGSVEIDPTGPSSGSYRVIRGSGWSGPALHVAARNPCIPTRGWSNVGFRLARTME